MTEKAGKRPSTWDRFYEVVFRIPPGKVASYGQVAGLAGLPGYARQVGYALNANPYGRELPWWRVLNARGEISLSAADGGKGQQMELLEAEGVEVDDRGRVSLRVFGWEPATDGADGHR